MNVLATLGRSAASSAKHGEEEMYLMIDIVLNHTSHWHEWARKRKPGDKKYQDFFYMYDDRSIPDEFEKSMPEIFPESSPGNFTWIKECNKWVMTVFHHYQWDLNYTNPEVFVRHAGYDIFLCQYWHRHFTHRCACFHLETIGNDLPKLTCRHITFYRLIKLVHRNRNSGNGFTW